MLAVLGGLTACGSDPSTPAAVLPPAHHATRSPTPSPAGHTTRIADDPQARLGAFGVIPGHPERRAATWYVCRDTRCSHRTSAAVVTSDGFRHRALVDLPESHTHFGYGFQPAGPDHFVVTVNAMHPRLVDLHGHVKGITVGGSVGPLASGEVPMGAKTVHWLGLDPDTGVAHPLSTPRDTAQMYVEPSGQLRVLTVHFGYFWSDDRGGSWHRMPLPPGDRSLMAGIVPTTDDSVHALQLGGDGATGFPWEHVLESTDGRTWTSYDGPRDPLGYGDPVAVSTGRPLVLDIHGWSDARNHHPSAHPSGSIPAPTGVAAAGPVAGPFAHQDSHTFDPRPWTWRWPPVGDDLRPEARREGRGVVDRWRRDLERRTSALIADPAGPFLRLPSCPPVCRISSSRSGVSWSPAGCRRWSRSPSSTSWPTAST